MCQTVTDQVGHIVNGNSMFAKTNKAVGDLVSAVTPQAGGIKLVS